MLHAANEFSFEANELIKENGYRWKMENDVLSIERSTNTKLFIYLIVAFISLGFIFIGLVAPIFALAILAVVWTIAYFQVKKLPKSSSFKLDFSHNNFHYGNYRQNVSDVDKIEIYSELIDEYASADKNTSKEYELSIDIQMNNLHHFRILTFRSDFPEPGQEVNEIFLQLKQLLRKASNRA